MVWTRIWPCRVSDASSPAQISLLAEDKNSSQRHRAYGQRSIFQLTAACCGRAICNPGNLYNLGNFTALFGGLAIQIVAMGQIKDIGALVRQYLFETPAAACLTLATMIFIISGAAYERALRNPQTSVRALVRLADILSGIAAILLTAALAHFGDTYLALLAGGMLAIGKTGSALVPETSDETRSRARLTWLFRMIVVVSRIPSIAGLAVSLWRLHDTGGTAADARMAALMLLCYVITLAADLLLIRHGQRKAG